MLRMKFTNLYSNFLGNPLHLVPISRIFPPIIRQFDTRQPIDLTQLDDNVERA